MDNEYKVYTLQSLLDVADEWRDVLQRLLQHQLYTSNAMVNHCSGIVLHNNSKPIGFLHQVLNCTQTLLKC